MRVGIVGDSQSEGLGPHLIPRLEAKGITVVGSLLERGMSLANMRTSADRRARARAIAEQSDVLLVVLGGNNRIDDPEAYEDHLAWFLNEVARRPRKIWWVGPAASIHPTAGPAHVRTRELQREILVGARRVKWIDAWPMTARGVEYAPDDLHFTRAGYRTWSSRLVDALPLNASVGLYLGAGFLGFAVGLFAAIRRHKRVRSE